MTLRILPAAPSRPWRRPGPRRCWLRWSLVACLMVGLNGPALAQRPAPQAKAKPTLLTLEISADPRAPLGSQQKWMEMLSEVGADRVKSSVSKSGVAAIDEKETESTILIRVQGFIERGKLELPGGSFSIRDRARISQLLEKFRDDGAEITLSEKKAFGLTAKQLVWLHQKLATPVPDSTRGRPASDVVGELCQLSGMEFTRDKVARANLSGSEVVLDELKGLSVGTALAATLRPLGLVMEPQRLQGAKIQMQLRDWQAGQEHWPIGWPLERAPVNVEPKLFERMPIEIKNFPLDKVLQAVEQRSQVPFLFDYNTLAQEGIELAEKKVSVSEKDSALMVTLGKLLRQTKPRLSDEIRIDEQGKAFVWITVR